MGIVVESCPPEKEKNKQGLRIISVTPGSAGFMAKLSKGDVITALNGEDPGNPYKFVMRLYGIRVGTPVKLQVSRQGQIHEINVVIQGG
jgi:S1-C subfamily serine protease